MYVKSNTVVGDQKHTTGVVMAEIVMANIPVKNGVVHLIHRPLMVVDTTVAKFLEVSVVCARTAISAVSHLFSFCLLNGDRKKFQVTTYQSLSWDVWTWFNNGVGCEHYFHPQGRERQKIWNEEKYLFGYKPYKLLVDDGESCWVVKVNENFIRRTRYFAFMLWHWEFKIF